MPAPQGTYVYWLFVFELNNDRVMVPVTVMSTWSVKKERKGQYVE